jgi:hypothetical protein
MRDGGGGGAGGLIEELKGAREVNCRFLEQKRTMKNEERPLFRAWPPHPINTIILALLFYPCTNKNNGSAASIANCMLF